jgi:hypothetical protein
MEQEHFRAAAGKRPLGEQQAVCICAPAWRTLGCVAVLLTLFSSAVASTITGTVVNRTTDKPSAGDRVVLYRVDQTMREERQTVTDGQGIFRFEGRADARYLAAAFHQGVSYHSSITRGTSSLEISVFDTAASLRHVYEDSDTLFFESSGSTLAVTEFFVISNRSNPPRTLTGESTFDFSLPGNAMLDSVAVQPPSTLPHRTSVLPQWAPGRYGLAYPIRPGITKIRAVYHLSYSGNVSIAPVVLRPVESMAVKIPLPMRVSTGQSSVLKHRGEENGLSVYLAKNLRPGRSLTFTLAGFGQLSKATQAKPVVATKTFPPAFEYRQEFFPQSQSKQGFVGITNRTVALYYEIPILLTALLTGIGALLHWRHASTRKADVISGAHTELD